MAQEQHAKSYERLHLIIETLRTVDDKEIDNFHKIYEKKYIYIIQRESFEISEDQNERIRNKIDRIETMMIGISAEINKINLKIDQNQTIIEEKLNSLIKS